VKIVAGFTTNRSRTHHGCGGVFVGKTAVILNKLPRAAWLETKFSVQQVQVRERVYHTQPQFAHSLMPIQVADAGLEPLQPLLQNKMVAEHACPHRRPIVLCVRRFFFHSR